MDAQWIFLDGDEERQQVIAQVRQVRADVIAIARQVPEAEHYQLRYGVWSLTQYLVYLWAFDVGGLLLINAAAKGITLKPPYPLVRQIDLGLRSFYARRVVETTIRDIQRKEDDICRFIERVPMSALHRDVFHPAKRGKPQVYTVEQAIQFYFVRHWQARYMLMKGMEDMFKTEN